MVGMPRRVGPVLGLVVALAIALGWASAAPAPTLAAWSGGVNLYRDGVYTTQKTWLWCTAAGVQIARNIVEGEADHSRSGQQRYFDWMRTRNRYDLPESAGVDPAGWTAGLRRFVDDRYRLVSSGSFDAALRSAVTSLRRTGLPVALTVSDGGHGWLLHGFRATADPAATNDFRVTSVRVTGPLWGRQNRSFGYDMRPNTQLTVAELRGFFTPWWYAPKRMVWDGRYVSIQPVGDGRATVRVAPTVPAPRVLRPTTWAVLPWTGRPPVDRPGTRGRMHR